MISLASLTPVAAQIAGPVITVLGALAAIAGVYFAGHRAGKASATAAASRQVEATDAAVIARQKAMSQAQVDGPRDMATEIAILEAGKL